MQDLHTFDTSWWWWSLWIKPNVFFKTQTFTSLSLILARLVENFDIARLVQKAGGCQELECPICFEEMRPPVILVISIIYMKDINILFIFILIFAERSVCLLLTVFYPLEAPHEYIGEAWSASPNYPIVKRSSSLPVYIHGNGFIGGGTKMVFW